MCSAQVKQTLSPAEVKARHDKAVALHKAGKLDEAAHIYSGLVRADRNNADGWFGLGTIAAQRGKPSDAIIHFERSMAITGPKSAHHHNMAGAKVTLGRFAEAEAHYAEAIRLQPDYAEAYFNYTNSRKFSDGVELYDKIVEMLGKPGITDADQCFLHFAAGKVANDLERWAEAWDHYMQANRLKGFKVDMDAIRSSFRKTASIFDQGFMQERKGGGVLDDRFVFIVGMPRSGTTLAESIIAAHPQAQGAGELPDIPSIIGTMSQHVQSDARYPELAMEISGDIIKGFGQAYARRVGSMHRGARIIVDKNPLNFRFVGMIRLMLPQARIIHCTRSPVDTCMSCFFQNFRSGQEYSFDLDNLASYYAGYRDLMEHWEKVAGPVFRLDYTGLVNDPEAVSKRLFDFIGLDWTPDVLNFHTQNRRVETASKWQVRQPLYKSSVGRERKYKDQVKPLKDALARHGVHTL
ncbi:MAG: hypothetical protein Alpg2KO_21200 [Alphaproteobacteria bacterium]